MMKAISPRVMLFMVAVLAALGNAAVAKAAGNVVLTASPTTVRAGESVEILVRTFLSVDRRDWTLAAPPLVQPYPVPSENWDVLYPWSDYPFDVVAMSNRSEEVVVLARDPQDATLWRGRVTLPSAGTWTIWVRNYGRDSPGASVDVVATDPVSPPSSQPTSPVSTLPATAGQDSLPLVSLAVAAAVGALAGFGASRLRGPGRATP